MKKRAVIKELKELVEAPPSIISWGGWEDNYSEKEILEALLSEVKTDHFPNVQELEAIEDNIKDNGILISEYPKVRRAYKIITDYIKSQS